MIKIDLVRGCAALVRCFWVTNFVTTFWSILPTFFWRILGKPVTRLPLLYLPYQLVVKWLDFLSKRQNICGRYWCLILISFKESTPKGFLWILISFYIVFIKYYFQFFWKLSEKPDRSHQLASGWWRRRLSLFEISTSLWMLCQVQNISAFSGR